MRSHHFGLPVYKSPLCTREKQFSVSPHWSSLSSEHLHVLTCRRFEYMYMIGAVTIFSPSRSVIHSGKINHSQYSQQIFSLAYIYIQFASDMCRMPVGRNAIPTHRLYNHHPFSLIPSLIRSSESDDACGSRSVCVCVRIRMLQIGSYTCILHRYGDTAIRWE